MNNKIFLAGVSRHLELTADAAIKPGHFVERTATGCKVQATSVGFLEKLIATEDALQGRTVADTYQTAAQNIVTSGDANATADPVMIEACESGCLVLALVKAGTHYTVGMQLFPYGDGTLRSTTGTPKQLLAVCEQDLDLSASGSVDTLCKVRIA